MMQTTPRTQPVVFINTVAEIWSYVGRLLDWTRNYRGKAQKEVLDMSVSSTSSTSSTGSLGGTYGLSGSGLDIDSLVKKLMAGQQSKDDALVQKQTVLQWQKAAYNTVSDDITDFRTNTVFNYKLQATLSPNKVTSSNTSVVTATANAGAAELNHSLVVSQLASGANLTSTAPISVSQPPTLGTIAAQMYTDADAPTSSFQFTISNGSAKSQVITINPNTDSLNDVVSAINNAGVNVVASYDSTLDRMFLSTANTGSSTGISISSTGTTGSTDNTAAFIGKLNLFGASSTATVQAAGNSLAITNAGGQNLGTVTIVKSAATTGVAAKSDTTNTQFNITAGVDGTSLNGVKIAFANTMTGTTAATALTSTWDASNQTLTVSGNLSSGGSAADNSTAMTMAIQTGLTTAGFNVGTMTDTADKTGLAANFAGTSLTLGGGVTNIASADTMAVDENNGNLTIYLANTTAANNTAANIQTAVKALGSGSTDFSKYTFVGQGTWDSSADCLGGNITQAVATLAGGTTPPVTVAANTSLNTTTTTFASASGQDAKFSLDNADLTETSNAFTISGVTYNLTGVTPSGSAATTVGVTGDIDTEVASIQSFVDSYNKILAELNSKISEPRYTDYPPLTTSQESAMSASDITLWNAKAQSGMLYNDDTLTSLVDTMRSAISSPVSGIAATNVNGTSVTYNSAASIGITTGDYTEGGKLYLNTDTLRTALQANPNVLNQLFGASGTTSTVNGVTTTNNASEGIAGRLYDALSNTKTQLTQIAGTTANTQYDTTSNLAKEIATYSTQITDATATFNTMQSQYYTQYNAMEVALQSLSSQSSWITSLLGTSSTG